MKNSPWGKVQHSEKTHINGITRVSTSGHGGYMVSAGVANKKLSPAAREKALKWGNYYCYEEDCLWAIVEFELFINQHETIQQSNIYENLSRWNPDYLLNRGLKPIERLYKIWLKYENFDQRRAAKDPNFVIAAHSETENVVKVFTADYKYHFVTKESYKNFEYHEYDLNKLVKTQNENI